jgi:exodeoxyribonuclease VIII
VDRNSEAQRFAQTQAGRSLHGSVDRNSYHLQAAHYSAGYREIVGWDLDRFMFIAVETEAPYMCRLYTLDPRSLQTGRLMMERAAIAWHEAQAMVERGETALAVEDVVELTVPNWAQVEPYEA